RKLAPAHFLILGEQLWDAEPRCYWRLQFEPDQQSSLEQWQEAIVAKVDETVRSHLMADVPVGAFLSGGVDSSVVVASAAGHTAGNLQTFSIGFREAAFSELPFARSVAERYGTQHTEHMVMPEAVDLVSDLAYYYDEPFADSSAV